MRQCVVDCSAYAHYVFNTFDQDHSGTISFEVTNLRLHHHYYYHHQWSGAQPRFQSWSPIYGLGYYYPSTKKLDRSTQFGAVGYIITLFITLTVSKVGGPSKFWRSGPPDPSGCTNLSGGF